MVPPQQQSPSRVTAAMNGCEFGSASSPPTILLSSSAKEVP